MQEQSYDTEKMLLFFLAQAAHCENSMYSVLFPTVKQRVSVHFNRNGENEEKKVQRMKKKKKRRAHHEMRKKLNVENKVKM